MRTFFRLCVLLFALAGAASAMAGERIETRVAAASDPNESYALFVPDGDSTTRPLLIVLDPRGRGKKVLDQFVPAARERGWIVLSSYGSRSDTDEVVTGRALEALLREAARYPHDAQRVYLAGMSGTAKTLWVVAPKLRGRIAGLLGSAGGRPPELPPLDASAPPFFGYTGTGDFNYQDMWTLDAGLTAVGTPHRLVVFEGWHGWPPAGFADALTWFDLQAMRAKRVPRDEAFIDAQFAACRKGVYAIADVLDRWRALEACIRDFDGLRDVTPLRTEAAALGGSPEIVRLRGEEKKLAEQAHLYTRRFNAWRERFGQRFSGGIEQPAMPLSESLRMLQVATLRKRAANADPRIAWSAKRQLAYVHVAVAFYLPAQFEARRDRNRVVALGELADALAPDGGS
jgi:predicted esterase